VVYRILPLGLGSLEVEFGNAHSIDICKEMPRDLEKVLRPLSRKAADVGCFSGIFHDD